ncbi:MAG: histidine--tRNA ligase [Anaerolineae bacterium]|nr:histidine--tRNA ligase [Anaerolineae bacterium]
MARFSRPKGTQDILPEDQVYWEHLQNVVAAKARSYGFERIDVPIFEMTELFARGVGEGTDIVEKEMYSFKDKGDRDMTLRPEFTAGVIRAYLENGMQVLPKPVKLYSIGPIFRYEEPQAGRYRQFHQFNAEIIGVQSALADLETMLLAWDIYDELGFKGLSFQLNSTGCPVCRPDYITALQAHYHEHTDVICEDCRRRIIENPLRVLDCKQAQCQPVIATAPKITGMLCDACEDHFGDLLGYLDALEKPYTLNHRLVRGLDYYTKTVFEVWAEGIGAQSAVCGGGRYDGLAKLLEGPDTPAVGFAAGMERIVLVMKEQAVAVPPLLEPPVYLIFLGDASRTYAVQLLAEIRALGIGAQIAMRGSLRSQLRHADKRGAAYAIIIGEDELARGEVTLRDMRSGEQTMVATGELGDVLTTRLGV